MTDRLEQPAPPDPSLYRACVGLMLLNRADEVFVGRRIDTGSAWQMPQGGIDHGETAREAAIRELREETGTDRAEFIAESDRWRHYDLPPRLQGKLWGGKYRGQRQTWFLARFTGEDADINLNAHEPPEFCEWKWVDPELLPELIVPFKRAVYAAIVEGFRDKL